MRTLTFYFDRRAKIPKKFKIENSTKSAEKSDIIIGKKNFSEDELKKIGGTGKRVEHYSTYAQGYFQVNGRDVDPRRLEKMIFSTDENSKELGFRLLEQSKLSKHEKIIKKMIDDLNVNIAGEHAWSYKLQKYMHLPRISYFYNIILKWQKQ